MPWSRAAWTLAPARPSASLLAFGETRLGRYVTECRLMLVLIGPGHSTEACTALLRPRRSRSSVVISATAPCLATL